MGNEVVSRHSEERLRFGDPTRPDPSEREWRRRRRGLFFPLTCDLSVCTAGAV